MLAGGAHRVDQGAPAVLRAAGDDRVGLREAPGVAPDVGVDRLLGVLDAGALHAPRGGRDLVDDLHVERDGAGLVQLEDARHRVDDADHARLDAGVQGPVAPDRRTQLGPQAGRHQHVVRRRVRDEVVADPEGPVDHRCLHRCIEASRGPARARSASLPWDAELPECPPLVNNGQRVDKNDATQVKPCACQTRKSPCPVDSPPSRCSRPCWPPEERSPAASAAPLRPETADEVLLHGRSARRERPTAMGCSWRRRGRWRDGGPRSPPRAGRARRRPRRALATRVPAWRDDAASARASAACR